jgi:hypothetical protein
MTDLIENIDCAICSCVAGLNHGLARLILDDKGPHYPIRVKDNKKVTPEDKFKVMWYHRLLDASPADSEFLSFGRTFARLTDQRIRMVVVSEISLGEGVIDSMIYTLPEKISLSAYRYAHTGSDFTLIRDQQSIWETEWGNAYKDKYQMRYNLYALEYSLQYEKCEDCVCS